MQKLQSSLAVEGDLAEDGLAAYGDTGDDQMIALARKLVSGETDDEAVVEDIYSLAQQIATEADFSRVNADWERPIAEPTPPVALPSGEEEPLVELVPCSSHHGQGEQQTLFS